jgi:hypothetical protein
MLAVLKMLPLRLHLGVGFQLRVRFHPGNASLVECFKYLVDQ